MRFEICNINKTYRFSDEISTSMDLRDHHHQNVFSADPVKLTPRDMYAARVRGIETILMPFNCITINQLLVLLCCLSMDSFLVYRH